MRLRNVPGSRDVIRSSEYCVHDPEARRGKWHEFFGNDRPVYIEIGMGKGRFLMDNAREYPDINFIGIEMYSSVLVRAIEKAEASDEGGERNFVFIRMDATYLGDVFAPGEADRIYLNFSDPWPKDRHAKRRLTSSLFLKRYEGILSESAHVEFKTDNEALFDFSLEQAKESGWILSAVTRDLHNDPVMNRNNIMTEYEEKFSALGHPIFKMISRPK